MLVFVAFVTTITFFGEFPHMAIWFISDLHLDASRPAITNLLLIFLQEIQEQAEALYILGDFFEYWVGDDSLDNPLSISFQPVLQQLRILSNNGTQLYFQQGNRDFLVGERFADTIGCTLLPEQHIIDFYGTPTLLMHGDSLCTDDIAYQQARVMLRNPLWQQQFLSLPLASRIAQAQAMRAQSQQAMQSKSEQILDVNPHAVMQVLQQNGVQQLIHGHTHRPAIHELPMATGIAKRIVLGDWHEDRLSYVRADRKGLVLEY